MIILDHIDLTLLYVGVVAVPQGVIIELSPASDIDKEAQTRCSRLALNGLMTNMGNDGTFSYYVTTPTGASAGCSIWNNISGSVH